MCMTAPSSGSTALAYSNSILFTYFLAEIKSVMNVKSNSSRRSNSCSHTQAPCQFNKKYMACFVTIEKYILSAWKNLVCPHTIVFEAVNVHFKDAVETNCSHLRHQLFRLLL